MSWFLVGRVARAPRSHEGRRTPGSKRLGFQGNRIPRIQGKRTTTGWLLRGRPVSALEEGVTIVSTMDVGQAEHDLSKPRYLVDPPSS